MNARDRYVQLIQDYPDGYVTTPGKFEGEPIEAIYFYELALDGGADEMLYDGDTPIDVFHVDDDDRLVWGLDDATRYVAVWETDQGFVEFAEWTEDEYRKAQEDIRTAREIVAKAEVRPSDAGDTCARCGSDNLGAFVCADCGGSNLTRA